MGDIADMMLDGTLCEGCGEFLDEDSPGHSRRCSDCSHTRAPVSQSIIVIGPQACGKTRFAKQIAKHYGLPTIVDEGKMSGSLRQAEPEKNGVLYLTNRPPPKRFSHIQLVQFDQIARALNLNLKIEKK